MADLGTVSILVDVRGQPIVKDLAKDLNNVATAEKQVSAATQKVMADFKRMQAITAMLKKTTDDTSNSFQRFSATELQQATQRMRGFESSLANTRRGMGQMGMATQQVGYQVGDFLVQIQSGTSAFVAFGQQATQLVGILPAFSKQLGMSVGSLIGISSVLGIAIPLATAFGAAWMRTSSEVKEGADKQKQAYDSVKQSIESLQLARQMASSGAQTESEQSVLNTLNAALEERKRLLEESLALEYASTNEASLQEAAARAELSEKQRANRLAILENEELLRSLGYQRELEVAARRRANEKRNEYREAEALRIEDEKALELARRKKDAFHAMAGEMGAVSSAMFSANDSAADILSNLVGATNAAMGLRDALGQVESAAASRADRIVSLTAQIAAVQRGAYASVAQAQAETAAQLSRTGASLDQIAAAAQNAGEQAKEIEKLEGSLKDLTKTSGGAAKGLKEAEKATEALRKELESPLVNAVGSISDAFGDFVARGLTDFKGFVQSILNSFKNMIAQMIAMAVKNRIMLSLGIGGITPGMAAAGQVAGLGSAGGMMGSLGIGQGIAGLAGGTGFLGGAGNAIAGLGGGGAGFFGIGANAAAAGGGFMATLGAAVPVLGAVALAFGFLRKKTKELDSGLRITVTNMDALVETFKTVQTTRFFGLSKKTTTTVGEAGAEISDPIVKAVQDIQTQVLKAAEMFGIAESEFADFVYKFDLSLKGLTDEQKLQKVNEELLKMGDAFTALSGQFTTMNELLAAAQQRYDLQTRLLELQGDTEALLARQRELELAAVHDLNLALLQQIHTLEDQKKLEAERLEIERRALEAAQEAARIAEEAAQKASKIAEERTSVEIKMLELQGKATEALRIQREKEIAAVDESNRALLRLTFALEDYNQAVANTASAAANLRSAMDRELAGAQSAMDAARGQLEKAVERRVATIQSGFARIFASIEAQIDSAKAKAESSRRIFELLDNALSGRSAVSEAGAFASRRAAMTYVSSGGMDVDKLTSALGVLNEPSEQFFGTFQDYARDFALTTNAIEQSRAVAEASMTADEKAVQLLEQSLEQQRASEAAQIAAVEKLLVVNEQVLTVEEAMVEYLAAQATYEQMQTQHQELIAQFPMLNESVLSVADAIIALSAAVAAQTAAQTAVANAIASAANVSTGDVPGFASGGMFSGGPRIVGENGPELEVTGPSRIYSNRDTANMFRDPELASAVDGLRREVSGMRSEQLQIQVEVSKNVKRIYDIERKWDTDGLPPERV